MNWWFAQITRCSSIVMMGLVCYGFGVEPEWTSFERRVWQLLGITLAMLMTANAYLAEEAYRAERKTEQEEKHP